MTVVDDTYAGACSGDVRAFAEWMGRVERPIRTSLTPFARAVDVEAIVQETLMRMWIYARDRGRMLTGENASLRFAIGMARNLARNEARRHRREQFLPTEDLPEIPDEPDPPPDFALRRAILDCIEKLPEKPGKALRARLERGFVEADRMLAAAVGMTRNTFLQNIVRARGHLARCLESRGVHLEGLAP